MHGDPMLTTDYKAWHSVYSVEQSEYYFNKIVHLCIEENSVSFYATQPWMKEVRDNTSRGGGLPTLPGIYLSTFQPSQRGFFRVHTFV